jgi:Mucin-2 protein WxxW repeating region
MKNLLTHTALALSVSFGSAAFAAGLTPWLDRDTPTGVGEFETTKDHLKITCRIKEGKKGHHPPHQQVTTGNPVGYVCDMAQGGGICRNSQTMPVNTCQDMEVMFSWPASRPGIPPYPAGHTAWLDRDNPSGTGDWETTKDLLKIKCQFKATGVQVTTGSPAGYTCDVPTGGLCKNGAPPGTKCQDLRVQYSW